MTAPRKRAGDVTGRATDNLAAQHVKDLEARAGEISLVNAAAAAVADEVIEIKPRDMTPPPPPEVEVIEVDVPEPMVEVRISETVEMMTFGVGNHYDFEAGRRYRVPRFLADHLEEKGLLWH